MYTFEFCILIIFKILFSKITIIIIDLGMFVLQVSDLHIHVPTSITNIDLIRQTYRIPHIQFSITIMCTNCTWYPLLQFYCINCISNSIFSNVHAFVFLFYFFSNLNILYMIGPNFIIIDCGLPKIN